MTTKEERQKFLEEMKGVAPLRRPERADVQPSRELTPGHLMRQRAAVSEKLTDQNPLTSAHVELLGPHDELAFKRDGVQNGVYRKLRLGQYPLEARLDLHRKTVEQARQEVFGFIRDCLRYDVRSVLILHGKGERNPDNVALIKSHLAKWLPELPDVMAFHSAQLRHGGTGAVYVMLRKSKDAREHNRELHGAL
ncbi:DNA endonuclease SmrA [Hydrocarboniclastica marina]|uniref:DNA endonuclease SmrA n=1 Tax=Hydrocarboniclastica marina TaxID=2259620 RepID=A0A4P7XI50_9ALTE|nr:DNA endonuclease SmrA [Hydrocarboniclastica marina]MAL98882.1 DNA endonuclease SmrA [Alteromonadaceae bacterium]QCF26395.1 DNA endonuclease SmrA [Hydrocarboniclastica marina]|tara:strand:+ start:589 stop:1170 length:582 start_codon:yes stop_codon:yes gene_type:complete